MADYNSSLPVRTETNGDVVVKLVDGTVNTQYLSIDAAGLIGSKLYDGAGNAITSQANGGQRALDVGIDVAGVQIDPRQIRALTTSDQITAFQGTSPWVVSGTVTVTQGTSPWVTSAAQSGTWTVGLSEDHNYGVVGANTLRTASQIGNATGAADFNFGTIGAQSLRVASQIGNATGAASFNYGAIGAQSLRTAAQIGNATGAADFNAGATSAQTLRTASNLYLSTGTAVSNANPLPVTVVDSTGGSSVNDYKDATSIAANASDNHDYTVTAGKTLSLRQITSSASGKAKMEVKVETGVATGVFTSYHVEFNSTSSPNMEWKLSDAISVAAGVRVRVTMTNRDNQSQDLYSTISGFEI